MLVTERQQQSLTIYQKGWGHVCLVCCSSSVFLSFKVHVFTFMRCCYCCYLIYFIADFVVTDVQRWRGDRTSDFSTRINLKVFHVSPSLYKCAGMLVYRYACLIVLSTGSFCSCCSCFCLNLHTTF